MQCNNRDKWIQKWFPQHWSRLKANKSQLQTGAKWLAQPKVYNDLTENLIWHWLIWMEQQYNKMMLVDEIMSGFKNSCLNIRDRAGWRGPWSFWPVLLQTQHNLQRASTFFRRGRNMLHRELNKWWILTASWIYASASDSCSNDGCTVVRRSLLVCPRRQAWPDTTSRMDIHLCPWLLGGLYLLKFLSRSTYMWIGAGTDAKYSKHVLLEHNRQ